MPKKTTATIVFKKKGHWLLSKQNSYLTRRNGSRYKNPKYVAEQQWYQIEAKQQLNRQGWKCTNKKVGVRIELHGPKAPVDADNVGLLLDALEGIAYVNDRQCFPLTVDWIKSIDRRILMMLHECFYKKDA